LLLGTAMASVAVSCGGGDSSQPTGGGGGDAGVMVDLDGGGKIPKPPDGEKLCPKGTCNFQTNAGCTGATTCEPALSPAGASVPSCEAAGAGQSGATCAEPKDCAPGYFCVGRACHKLCCGGDWSGCDSPKEHCFRGLEYAASDGGTIETGAMICDTIDTCDALTPASCNEQGFTCQIVDATGAQACAPEGTGDQGQACPCKGGFLCVANACRRLCKAVEGGAAPFCQESEGECVHFNRDPAGIGECTP
jgi:hypothetical protein